MGFPVSLFPRDISGSFRCPEVRVHEEDVPAESRASQTQARFSATHVDQSRSSCFEAAPETRPQSAECLRSRPKSEFLSTAMVSSRAVPAMSQWPTLKSRSQFERVYSQGKKQARRPFVLFYLEETSSEGHVAFVASRKVGGAVQRNRAKRLLRAAFRQVVATQNMPEGWWVLVARQAILQYKSHQVAEELLSLVNELATQSAPQPPPT